MRTTPNHKEFKLYDNNMELAYEDDALSFDTTVTLINRETGEDRSVTFDNLTNAMYFLVLNGLHPIREGVENLGKLNFSPEARERVNFGDIETSAAEIHESWREQNTHGIALTITAYGDLSLLDQVS